MNKADISIIIPAYNESATIGGVIENLKEQYPEFEIIIINDGSKDNTAEIARESGVIVYSHPYNMGNGAAIKSGMLRSAGIYRFWQ